MKQPLNQLPMAILYPHERSVISADSAIAGFEVRM
jgi:hypothetical protein